MLSGAPTGGLCERFCKWLGRQNAASDLLDKVARLVVPLPPELSWAGSNAGDRARLLIHAPMEAAGPDTNANTPNSDSWTYRGNAPAAPHDKATGTTTQSVVTHPGFFARIFGAVDTRSTQVVRGDTICAEEKYHGMHGTPCLYSGSPGGTDLSCPTGTVSGWFWSYKTANGVFYYVDCCGGAPKPGSVWCNWTNESNWCYGGGKAQNGGKSQEYHCTLAVPSALMVTKLVPGKAPETIF